MSTRGRPRKTADERKPPSVQFPYQEVIWSQYLSAAEQKKYIKHCSAAVRAGGAGLDIYDYYQRAHTQDAQLPIHFPPRDPRWRPASEQATSSTRPAPGTVLPVGVGRSTPLQPPTGPLDDFTRGLREILDATYPLHRACPPTQQPQPQPPAAGDKDQPAAPTTSQPAPGRSQTPWNRSQERAHPQRQPRNKSPTLSPLSSAHHSNHAAADVSPLGHEIGDNVGGSWIEEVESVPMLRNLDPPEAPRTRAGRPALAQPISALGVSRASPSVQPPASSSSHITATAHDNDDSEGMEDEQEHERVDSEGGSTTGQDSETDVPPAPRRARNRRRGRDLPDGTTVPAQVYRVVQAVTAFHCDCRDGFQHGLDAHRHRFSLRELCRSTSDDRCFPLAGETLPRPFHTSKGADAIQADFGRVDFAQYLSTHPSEHHPRSKLRLRSSTSFPTPLENNFHLTWDVDSTWIRLNELSDLAVPLELTYTPQRHLNIKGSQHIPLFSSDDFTDTEFHKTAHSVFAKLSFATCTARIYVFWPFVKEHNKTVITDKDFAVWIDGVVFPALRALDSCAWQDHPKSFQDARARAYHRGEVQIAGSQGQADVGYTLSPRFTAPLVETMRQIVAAADAASSLFRFRSFSFVMIVHDLKRAFNAETPRFDAFRQFHRALAATFHPAYLTSTTLLDRSFADFGVEYNIRKQISEPTTLLVRRTCLEHRFSTVLADAGDRLTAGIGQPQLFTTYSLHDAATGRIFFPARAPISAVMPMIKGYNLHKHTCHTHFRHEHSSPFTLPHLDMLCLTDGLLKDVHQGIKGTFIHRNVAAIHGVLTQTLNRLDEALEANTPCHTGVRIEPRVSMRYLFGLLDEEDWSNPFDPSSLESSQRHPFVFAVATADLNNFIRNYLQRMTAALAAQRFDLFGPSPGWNSMTVRHRLGTTTVLLKIMATFFAGDQRHSYNLKAAKYMMRRQQPGRLVDDHGPVNLGPDAVAVLAANVRIGLLMDGTMNEHGCYWLPRQIFDFLPRPQLKPHLLTRVTLARPRLLGKAQISWKAPVHSRRAYEGDVVFDIVLAAARRLRRMSLLPDEDDDYLQHRGLRMKAWLIMKPVILLLARGFFRYIASLTQHDPCFLPLEDNEFGVPFNALTYGAVTRLLGTEPVLITPRDSKKAGGKASWARRLQHMFDDTSNDQWQKTAAYLVELRRWIAIWKDEGVPDCYIEVWREDVGLLMRPFVWILPSHERKTLFRLDRSDGQLHLKRRLCTRWQLPGVVIKHREPVMALAAVGAHGQRLEPRAGKRRLVDKVSAQQRRRIDPFQMARRFLQDYRTLDADNDDARGELIDKTMDDVDDFQAPLVQWYHDRINDSEFAAGFWVPFWTCGDEFPADDMQELGRQIARHQQNFEPAGGFYSLIEAESDDERDSALNNNYDPQEYQGDSD